MNTLIGIFGSAAGQKESTEILAKELGRELARQPVMLISGATTGVPYLVTHEAYTQGNVKTIGFSAARNQKEHDELVKGCDNNIYSKLIFVPKTFPFDDIQVRRKYRNVISTATCDAGIIVSGRWGTMNEFTNLYDFGKIIGILVGSGGIADELDRLSQVISKPGKAVVIYDSNPKQLITKVLGAIEERKTS